MTDENYCPFISTQVVGGPALLFDPIECMEEECNLYDEEAEQCAIMTIVKNSRRDNSE